MKSNYKEMSFKDFNKKIADKFNEFNSHDLQERLNEIVDDVYFALYKNPEKIKKDIDLLNTNGKNYNDGEFKDINHYAWFRGTQDGGSEDEVFDKIDSVLKLADLIRAKMRSISIEHNGYAISSGAKLGDDNFLLVDGAYLIPDEIKKSVFDIKNEVKNAVDTNKRENDNKRMDNINKER